MSGFNCCFLTCIQVSQEAGQVVWYSHLFQNFPQFMVIHTVEGFGIVNKAEIDVFLELSCFFDHPADVGNLISGSSAFSKTSLTIWKFMVYVLLKHGLENFEHYFTSVWDECNCAVVWAFFGIAFLRDWNENWPFPVLWHCHVTEENTFLNRRGFNHYDSFPQLSSSFHVSSYSRKGMKPIFRIFFLFPSKSKQIESWKVCIFANQQLTSKKILSISGLLPRALHSPHFLHKDLPRGLWSGPPLVLPAWLNFLVL